jgi:DNA-binding NarL/FixJ family response regulator
VTLQSSEPRVGTKRGPYRVTRNHPFGLSGKEALILDMLRFGATNAAIAKQLNRSRRTVEHHVSSILTKLGVSSRKEAAGRVGVHSCAGRAGETN